MREMQCLVGRRGANGGGHQGVVGASAPLALARLLTVPTVPEGGVTWRRRVRAGARRRHADLCPRMGQGTARARQPSCAAWWPLAGTGGRSRAASRNFTPTAALVVALSGRGCKSPH